MLGDPREEEGRGWGVDSEEPLEPAALPDAAGIGPVSANSRDKDIKANTKMVIEGVGDHMELLLLKIGTANTVGSDHHRS